MTMKLQGYGTSGAGLTRLVSDLRRDPAVSKALSVYRKDPNPRAMHDLTTAVCAFGVDNTAARDRAIAALVKGRIKGASS